jgi:twitching motility protein PilT
MRPDPRDMLDLAVVLQRMSQLGGSDLLLKVGNRPLIRVNGVLQAVDPADGPLQPMETEQLLHDMLMDTKLKEFENTHEIDFAYSAPGLGRFRVSAYLQRGSVSIAMRAVPYAVNSIEELGLPDVVRQLAEAERGLVVVTGGTSSGKSTTLAAMVAHINRISSKHVVTIEDPIEYLHHDEAAAIDQREVGSDTESFRSALRRVLRQDPDVILIGEMRDEETVRTALAAGETGHLVLSTLHTLDAGETINRLIDFFQPHEHQHVRAMLAGTLRGIVSQRLARTVDGQGRLPICEVLTMTGRVHDCIVDSEGDLDVRDIIAEGSYYGMQTFDQALFDALSTGAIGMDEALRLSSHPHDFKLLVEAHGRMSTSMADLEDGSGHSDRHQLAQDHKSANGAPAAAGGNSSERRRDVRSETRPASGTHSIPPPTG